MATKDRATTNPLALAEALHREPYKFGFYQALRRLESAYSDKPRIGTSVRPVDDAVRFVHQPSLAFAPSTLA